MPRMLERPRRETDSPEWSSPDMCAVQVSSKGVWISLDVRSRDPVDQDLWRDLNPPHAFSSREPLIDQVALEVEFEDLADTWEAETDFESVVIRKAMHPAYQRVIGLGRPAVPLILRRLQREPRQWFWALTAITGENPAADHSTAEAAADAWLDWGHKRGLIIE